MNAICLTPKERTRLAALYPPEPTPPAPPAVRRKPFRSVYAAKPPDRTGHTSAFGEAHGMSVLTADLVKVLRAEVAAGVTIKDAAGRRGLATNTVLHAVRGDTWAHLPGAVRGRHGWVQAQLAHVLRGSVLAEWRASQLAKRIGTGTPQVCTALNRFWHQGKVERTGRGLYRWVA